MRVKITLVLLAIAAFACEDGLQGVPGINEPDASAPLMAHFGVSIEPYDSQTGMAGDFLFDPSVYKVMVEFGQLVDTPDGQVVHPNFEFRVAPATIVRAPRGGVITAVTYQESFDDYEIHLAPSDNSRWTIVFDHVHNPTVLDGESVSSETPLGEAADWENGLARVDLMIARDDGRAFCPMDILLEGTDQPERVLGLFADWEAYRSDADIYDEAEMIRPGCLRKTVDLNP